MNVSVGRILLLQKDMQLPDNESILTRVKKNNQHFQCTIHKDSARFTKRGITSMRTD